MNEPPLPHLSEHRRAVVVVANPSVAKAGNKLRARAIVNALGLVTVFVTIILSLYDHRGVTTANLLFLGFELALFAFIVMQSIQTYRLWMQWKALFTQ